MFGPVAQLGEQLLCTQKGVGSTPIGSTKLLFYGHLAQLVRALR